MSLGDTTVIYITQYFYVLAGDSDIVELWLPGSDSNNKAGKVSHIECYTDEKVCQSMSDNYD